MHRKFQHFALVAFAAAFFMGLFAAVADAGEARLPLRTQKIKEGDWIFYEENGDYVKETATGIEKGDDDYIVHYTRETFSPDGKVTDREEVARFLSGEREDHAEILKGKGIKYQRRRTKIEGKNVEVLAVIYPAGDESSIPYEMWYSDGIGITGIVAMVLKLPSEEEEDKIVDEKAIETLGFGDAKTPFNFKKYVR